MDNIFKNHHMKIVLGILWGFGLACIFRSACHGRKCIIYKAPNPQDIENSTYHHNEKCYRYVSIPTDCTDDVLNT